MATSGSTDWLLQRDEIIKEALVRLGAISIDDTPSAAQVSDASKTLNSIVKNLQTEGVRLWSLDWKTKTLTASTQRTNNSVVYTCIRSHTSAASNEPGVGADWTTYWIVGGTPGASAWVTATSYVSIGDFTVDSDTIGIEQAYIRRNNYDHPVKPIGGQQYMEITDKTQTGLPTVLWFNKQLTGKVYMWPQPDSASDVLHYFRIRKLEDFDAAANDPDFNSKWIEVLIVKLEYKLASKYGIPLQERLMLEKEAEILMRRAKGDDTEDSGDFIESAY